MSESELTLEEKLVSLERDAVELKKSFERMAVLVTRLEEEFSQQWLNLRAMGERNR
jgi:hypothetical protein